MEYDGYGIFTRGKNAPQPNTTEAQTVVHFKEIGKRLDAFVLSIGKCPRTRQVHRLVTDNGVQFLSLRNCPCGFGTRGRRSRGAGYTAGELAGQIQNGEVAFGKTDQQFIVALNLLSTGNLLFDQRQAELLAEKAIGLFSVRELIVVRAGIAVLVPLERIIFPVKPEKRFSAIVNEGLDQRRTKTAVVFGVVDQ